MEAFFRIRLSQSNCYLLKGTEGYLLIDCGNAGDGGALLANLKRLAISPLSIRWLLLTHHHSDHCGLLDFLLALNPDIRLIMSRKCAVYLAAGEQNCSLPEEKYASRPLGCFFRLYRLLGGKLTGTVPSYLIRGQDLIVDGECLELPFSWGIPGKLLATPGHTWDSISLVVGEHGFVGDAARNMLNFLGAAYRPFLISDPASCRQSWKLLLDHGVERVYPGHGNVFAGKCLKELANNPFR